jgi:hypothetical protein
MPRVSARAYYRLKIRARSLDELSATAGIRRGGSPYNFLWQVTLTPGLRWRDYTLYAELSPADYDVGFYILLGGAGRFDIGAFQLDKLTEQELIAEIGQGAEGQSRNLFRNTRFPLGLPAGWVLDRDSSDGDAVQIGADGNALRISGDRLWRVTSEPFAAPKPKSNFTVSFTARGAWRGRLIVESEGRWLATKQEEAGAEPRRLSLTFTAPLLSRAQGLQIEGSGDLWVEDFQLEEGNEASEFTPPTCELHFGSTSPIRTVFDDSPLVLQYTTYGGDACRAVKLRVENLKGEETDLPAEGIHGEVLLPAEFGAYRVEGWVEGEDGKRLGPYQEMTLFRLHTPKYWGVDAPRSPFGVHTNSTTRHIQMAKAAGINWTRLHDAGLGYIGWYHVEPKPGEWTFFDDDILRYRQHGMKVLGLLSTAPEWASYFDKPRNGYYDRFYQPRELNWYAHYAEVVAERYRGVIDTWDVWNEPWNKEWWAVGYDEATQNYVTSKEPEADFVKLQRRAVDGAKAADPSLTVLGVNSTTGDTGTAWTRGVVQAGGLEPSDVICYHQYTSEQIGFENDVVERGWRQALEPAMVDGQVGKPVWMTEGSPVMAMSGAGFYKRAIPFQDYENFLSTSDRLVRFVVALLAQRVEKVFLYSMHSYEGFSMRENPWRVIVGMDGYLHPNAAAHSAMAWMLEDKQFVTRFEPSPGVTAYLFEGGGQSVAVLAPRPGVTAEWMPPTGLSRFDMYGNPVGEGSALGRYVSYAAAGGDAAGLRGLLAPAPGN